MTITDDAIDALVTYLSHGSTLCPSCGRPVTFAIRRHVWRTEAEIRKHAETCTALRADVAIKD